VARVSFDVVWMYEYIDGIMECWGMSSSVASFNKGDDPKMIVLFFVLCIVLYIFKSC
jgi:hypothetical protein